MFTIYEILVKYWSKIILTVVTGIVLIAIVNNLSHSESKKNVPNVDDLMLEAYYAATTIIKQNLKSPKSAIFPVYDSRMVRKEGVNLYRVTSYVDSQNSFGAMLRTDFNLLMRDDGIQWTVIEHEIISR